MNRPSFPAYRRIPRFTPVPLRNRADGWTPMRQARFIGFLAQTGSVAEAARLAGCSRETAYRLRRRAGAEGFAHAWDAALALRSGKPVPARKVTPGELRERAMHGAMVVVMRRGRFLCAHRKPCVTSLLRLIAGYRRALRNRGEAGLEKPGGRATFGAIRVNPAP